MIDSYFDLRKAVFDYFGYVEDWVSIPLEDSRSYFWKLRQDANGRGEVIFHETMESVKDEDGSHYVSQIYTQRFLPKWVYRTEHHTMICTNPQVDGNRFLSIFTNSLEIKG